MNKLAKIVLSYNLNKKDIIRELKKKEIEEIKQKYNISFYFKAKRYLKFLLLRVIQIFLLKNYSLVLRSRMLENVKKKYDRISGIYIKNYISKKSSFIGEINMKKIVELRGTYEKYYSQFLYNFFKKNKIESILEVGAGELTLIADFLQRIKKRKKIKKASLDISFKRLKDGKKFLKKNNISLDYIIRGDAANLPFADNSFDLIYTSHCLEQVPNLFNKIVDECIRVSKKYVVFIEPSYEFGSKVTKDHIYKKGYPKISKELFKEDKYKILMREPLQIRSYINGTEIIILKKTKKIKKILNKNLLVCPKCKEFLVMENKSLICKKENLIYKIQSKIPLLEKTDGKLII